MIIARNNPNVRDMHINADELRPGDVLPDGAEVVSPRFVDEYGAVSAKTDLGWREYSDTDYIDIRRRIDVGF